jgi:beta-lactamase superfamily II metal-dependent hydrolase
MRRLDIIRGEFLPNPLRFADASIHVLHPHVILSELHRSQKPGKINETSLVLRFEYGYFSLLLLGDIEKEGLSSLLRFCRKPELRCNIVKIPHHGAWQRSSEDLSTLLTFVASY